MSFSTQAPAATSSEPKLLNLDSNQLSTNQEAIPIPYGRGHQRWALKWITPALRRTTTDIKQDMGKGGDQVTGFNYYGDLAGFVQVGPVSAFKRLIIDNNLVWEGSITLDGAGPELLQVAQYGDFFHYFGTDSQSPDSRVLNLESASTYSWDPILNPQEFAGVDPNDPDELPAAIAEAASTNLHPAYKGIAYVSIRKLFFGANRTSAPNVEVEVESAPVSRIGLPTDITAQGVNPITCVEELLLDPRFGLGLDSSALDVTSFRNAANRIRDLAHVYYMSPFSSRKVSAKQLIGLILVHIDGFFRYKEGKIQIDFYPHDGVYPQVRELSHADMTELPTYDPSSYDDTVNEVFVVYRDVTRYLKETSQKAQSQFNQGVTGEVMSETLDRKFFVTGEQAMRYAEEYVQTASFPITTGRVVCRAERAVNLDGSDMLPGDRLQLDDAHFSQDIIVRCTKRTDHYRDGTCTLEFRQEAGLFAMEYSSPVIRTPLVAAPVAGIEHARILELTPEFIDNLRTAIVVLAERPAPDVEGFNVWYSDSGASYDLMRYQTSWALRATLLQGVADMPETSPEHAEDKVSQRVGFEEREPVPITLRISASGPDLVLLQPKSAQAQLNNELLLIIDGEWFSVGNVTAEGSGQYRVDAFRARESSRGLAHATGAECWIIEAESLQRFQMSHRGFVTGDRRYFKLQSRRIGSTQPLDEALLLTYDFLERESTLPDIHFYPDNPVKAETGESFKISGQIFDPNEDIVSWSLMMVNGATGEQTIVGGASIVPTGRVVFSVPITVLSPQEVYFVLSAQDYDTSRPGVSTARWPVQGYFIVSGEDLTNKTIKDDLDAFDADKAMLWDLANQTLARVEAQADQLVEQALDFAAQIELTETGFGTQINQVKNQLNNELGALSQVVQQIGARSNTNAAAIVQEQTARVSAVQALTQQFNTLVSRLNSAENSLSGLSSTVNGLKTDVQEVEGGIATMAQNFTVLKSDIKDLEDETEANATAIRNTETTLRNINGTLTGWATDIHNLQISDAQNSAKVQTLSTAFLGPDGQVKAIWGVTTDANGTFGSLTLLSDSTQKRSTFEIEVDQLILKVGGKRYRAVLDFATAAIYRAVSHNGNPAWEIGNNFALAFMPTDGSGVGGKAEVLVHNADGR
ncbi:MAG: hypothetical protein ABQ298_03840 [Puniceicoccaceae bacterium]